MIQLLEGEEFRTVPGYPEMQVSNMGRVFSCAQVGPFGKKGQWREVGERPSADQGRCHVWLRSPEGDIRKKRAVLVLEVFVGPRPDGMEACHNNGDPSDDRLENLRWDTRKSNHADKRTHGTHQFGSKLPWSKLDDESVLDICRRVASGEKQYEVAALYRVGASAVNKIIGGNSWVHLRDKIEKIFTEANAEHLLEPNRFTRLTPEQVREIREFCESGNVSQNEAARFFGVSQGTVWSILRGKTTGHQPKPGGKAKTPRFVPAESIPEPNPTVDGEIWKEIPNCPHFRISNFGNVRSRYDGRGRLTDEWREIVTHSETREGSGTRYYFQVRTTTGVKKKTRYRAVLEAFVGPCPEGCEARHLNGDESDDRLDNLVWGNRVENAEDRRSHGTLYAGDKHWNATLNRDDVMAICESLADGKTQKELADLFGVRQTMISQIVNGKAWKEIQGEIRAVLDRPNSKVRRIKKHGSRMTEEKVAVIKRRLLDGVKQKEIAAEFGVRQGMVSFIATGKCWPHVEAAESEA